MVHGLMLLKWTVRKNDGSLWNGLTRGRVESSDRPFVNMGMNFRFRKYAVNFLNL